MRVKIAPFSVEGQYHLFCQAFAPSVSTTRKHNRKNQNAVCQVVLSSPFKSRKLLRSQTFDKPVSRAQSIKRCSANLDEGFEKEHIEGLARGFSRSDYEYIGEGDEINRWSSVSSEAGHASSGFRMNSHCKRSSLLSEFDFLEPVMLGIGPEPPDWPEREAVSWISIEQKAKSFDFPLSLRMIKKKKQLDECLKDLRDSACLDSVNKAFSSMAFILVEIQSHVLQMREALCHEDLEMIIEKVQREMYSSFSWLFQQVFPRTPDLMIYVMVLLANFGVYSISQSSIIAGTGSSNDSAAKVVSKTDKENQQTSHFSNKKHLIDSSISTQNWSEEFSQIGSEELRNIGEMSLWKSMVDEAEKRQAEMRYQLFGIKTTPDFVSPISVELEPDESMECRRTDLLYQMRLLEEPNNQLLLCNYAKFLHLVVRDHDRAEECYKRAIQVEPPDAEALSQYANFLWTIRKDFWGAEETYQHAIAAEPENPHYASKYVCFLFSTGADETCYPLDSSSSGNKSLNL